jgi:hypothetical protein
VICRQLAIGEILTGLEASSIALTGRITRVKMKRSLPIRSIPVRARSQAKTIKKITRKWMCAIKRTAKKSKSCLMKKARSLAFIVETRKIMARPIKIQKMNLASVKTKNQTCGEAVISRTKTRLTITTTSV